MEKNEGKETIKKDTKGITLIALVVTIIVLLILAGISISMLSGNNGILTKAGEAKEKNEIGQEKEIITSAYNSILVEKKSKPGKSEISVEEFAKSIKDYDENVIVESERKTLIATFPNGHKYSIYYNGKISEYTQTHYAKDEIAVIDLGSRIESPFYINYPSNKGTIKCRALYNDNNYGLQIISVDSVTDVELGRNDENENVLGEKGSIERAHNSYNRAIKTLNEKAEEYLATIDGKILATDARCVGSEPSNKNYPDNLEQEERTAEMYIDSGNYMNDNSGKFFNTDAHYQADYNQLKKIGIAEIGDKATNKYYWLASRKVYLNDKSNIEHLSFLIRLLTYSGEDPLEGSDKGILWIITTNQQYYGLTGMPQEAKYGLRPVFTLTSDVKIIGGEGTEEQPFEIGL